MRGCRHRIHPAPGQRARCKNPRQRTRSCDTFHRRIWLRLDGLHGVSLRFWDTQSPSRGSQTRARSVNRLAWWGSWDVEDGLCSAESPVTFDHLGSKGVQDVPSPGPRVDAKAAAEDSWRCRCRSPRRPPGCRTSPRRSTRASREPLWVKRDGDPRKGTLGPDSTSTILDTTLYRPARSA